MTIVSNRAALTKKRLAPLSLFSLLHLMSPSPSRGGAQLGLQASTRSLEAIVSITNHDPHGFNMHFESTCMSLQFLMNGARFPIRVPNSIVQNPHDYKFTPSHIHPLTLVSFNQRPLSHTAHCPRFVKCRQKNGDGCLFLVFLTSSCVPNTC